MNIIKLARMGALGGAAVLASLTGTMAQESSGVFFKNILGEVGIIPKERAPIEYRERAPLVLPPKIDLRDPVDATEIQMSNPQWPNDPDVAAARRQAAEARVPRTQSERYRMNDERPTLSIDEIRAGRRPGAEIPTEPVRRLGDNQREATWMHPDELRGLDRKKYDEAAPGPEPERRALIEPPTGYRKPTQKVTNDFEPIVRVDESDPKRYWTEQAQGR